APPVTSARMLSIPLASCRSPRGGLDFPRPRRMRYSGRRRSAHTLPEIELTSMNKSRKPIRKAVFPVAGLGTRFLPASKAVPKEMLTVVDRPIIQHVVDEAMRAGIEHFIFVTGRNKGAIEDHFDSHYELEALLQARGKVAELEALRHDLPRPGQTSFTRQQAPLGLGHAVWCARDIVGDEPFAL